MKKSLSKEAKLIFEYIQNLPIDQYIEIQVDKNFQTEVFNYVGNNSYIDIPVNIKLFSEIIRYVASDDKFETISYDANINKYVFKKMTKKRQL